MRRRLLPLSAIQGFEAAARHLSFRRAAEELNLTQSAVSHQVKALEAFLGITLFERQANRIALTAEGLAYLGDVLDSLERLEAGSRRAQGVALAYGALIDRELASGTLVRVFDEATEPVLIYSLACLEGRASVPKIAAFHAWIMDEVSADPPSLPAVPARLRLAAPA